MNILEMIAEWRKGCSCTVGKEPYECRECTVNLIFAIEGKVTENVDVVMPNPATVSEDDKLFLIEWCEQQIRSNKLDSTTYYGGDTTPEARSRNEQRQEQNGREVIKFQRLMNFFYSIGKSEKSDAKPTSEHREIPVNDPIFYFVAQHYPLTAQIVERIYRECIHHCESREVNHVK